MANEVDRTVNLVHKNADITLKGVTTFMTVLATIGSWIDKNNEMSFLKKHMAVGGDIKTVLVDSDHLRALTQNLDQQGVDYHIFNGANVNGQAIVCFRDIDEHDVMKAAHAIRYPYRVGGSISKEMLAIESGDRMIKIPKLDWYEAKTLEGLAEQHRIHMYIEQRSEKSFDVYFSENDRDMCEKMKRTLAIQNAHPDVRHAIKKQVDYETKNEKDLMYEAVKYEGSIPYYIVDAKGCVMRITEDKVSYREKDGEEITVSYTDPLRMTMIRNQIASMSCPVKLDVQSYEEYEQSENPRKFLAEKDIENGRPKYSAKEQTAFKQLEKIKEIENRELMEEKLAMSNPEQEILEYSYMNNEMRMTTFQEFEQINEDAVHDRNEQYVLDGEFYDDARSRFRGYTKSEDVVSINDLVRDDYNRSDIDISALRLDHSIEELGIDMDLCSSETELMNDMNGNLIPDDLERGDA